MVWEEAPKLRSMFTLVEQVVADLAMIPECCALNDSRDAVCSLQ